MLPTHPVTWIDRSAGLCNVTAVLDPDGARVEYTYDAAHGFLLARRSAVDQVTEYEYAGVNAPLGDSPWGAMTAVRDPHGLATHYKYDAAGRLSGVLGPLGHESMALYFGGPWGAEAVEIREWVDEDWDSFAQTVVYLDGFGRTLQTLREATRRSVGEVGNVFHEPVLVLSGRAYLDKRGLPERLFYPAFVSLDELDRPEPGPPPPEAPSARVALDAAGRVVRAEAPFGGDLTGAKTVVAFESGKVTREDPVGRQHVVQLDARRLPWFVDPDAGGAHAGVKIERDPFGRILAVDELRPGARKEYQYHALGHLEEVVDPDRGTWSYEHTAGGDLERVTDADQRTTRFTYDAAHRVTQVELAVADGGTVERQYHYDGSERADHAGCAWEDGWVRCQDDEGLPDSYPAGRLTAAGDDERGRTHHFRYDVLGRLKSRSIAVGQEVYRTQFRYDRVDRPVVTTYPSGTELSRYYDNRTDLTAVYAVHEGAPEAVVVDRYLDALGRPVETVFGNGVVERRSYYSGPAEDQRLREIQVVVPDAAGDETTLFHHQYEYYADGKLRLDRNRRRGYDWDEYRYDLLGRLERHHAQRPEASRDAWYEHDALSNLTCKGDTEPGAPCTGIAMEYGVGGGAGPHAISSVDGVPVGYDASGRTRFRGATSYEHLGDTLIEASDGVTARHFELDPFGRRIRSLNEAGAVEWLEPSSDYAVLPAERIWVAAPGILASFAPAPPPEGGGTVEHYHLDRLGSPVVVTSEAQVPLAENRYGPSGEISSDSDNPTALPYEYTGARNVGVAALGGGWSVDLLQLGFRDYDASLMRFLTTDPLRSAAPGLGLPNPVSLNPYAYAALDPVNHIDPTGLEEGLVARVSRGGGTPDDPAAVRSIPPEVIATYVRIGRTQYMRPLTTTYGAGFGADAGTGAWVDPTGELVIDLCTDPLGRVAEEVVVRAGFDPLIAIIVSMFVPGFKATKLAKVLDVAEAVKKGQKALRLLKLTRRNFRKNLVRWTGRDPGAAYQAHHVFPHALAERFDALGIDVNNPLFGTWVGTGVHQKISHTYNDRWIDFFDRPQSAESAVDYSRELAREFGLVLGF